MSGLVTTITTGVTAFSATNIDDLVILLLFFTKDNSQFRRWQIVCGQYLGFAAIVIASLPGFFGGLFLPDYWIGWLGYIPILIGLNGLVNREMAVEEEEEVEISEKDKFAIANLLSPQTYMVASITFANGTDNISVYVPLFANSSLGNIAIVLAIFFLLVGVWCYAAYQLIGIPQIASTLTYYGSAIVPFILIGLGAFIVLENHSLSFFKLIASCFCLAILLKKEN